MTVLQISQLSLVEEAEASEDVAHSYDDIKRIMEIPFIPNIHKTVANSPTALAGVWAAVPSASPGGNRPSSPAAGFDSRKMVSLNSLVPQSRTLPPASMGAISGLPITLITRLTESTRDWMAAWWAWIAACLFRSSSARRRASSAAAEESPV